MHYCSVFHQNLYWTHKHQKECEQYKVSELPEAAEAAAAATESSPSQTEESTLSKFTLDNILLPEYELVMEKADNPYAPRSKSSSSEEGGSEGTDEERRLAEYRNHLQENGSPSLQGLEASELEKYTTSAAAIKEDRVFRKFRKICSREPEQVIRYYRNGCEPLWIARVGQEIGLQLLDVPDCPKCLDGRTFEFQVMPQLLNFFDEDDIDWGTVLIYSCSNSCDLSFSQSSYIEEHVIKQDV